MTSTLVEANRESFIRDSQLEIVVPRDGDGKDTGSSALAAQRDFLLFGETSQCSLRAFTLLMAMPR